MAVEPPFPAFLADLLPAWRLSASAGAQIAPAARGTNNQTFLVSAGSGRFVLRISHNLSVAQVQAEQRLLGLLRQGSLPFTVPEPLATSDGVTLIETPAGPATLCRWLPGVRPDLDGEPALERFGRAVGLLGQAMQRVPPADAPQDWRGAPLPVRVDGQAGEALWRELRAAGLGGEQAALLDTAARRVARWWAGAVGTLPVQVVIWLLGVYDRLDRLGSWAAESAASREFLGWFHLRPGPDGDPANVELGYRLRRPAWNQGYATEGSRALISMGFSDLGVGRVYAHTMAVNTASRHVLEKCGLALVRTAP